jgi:hypothetical protein
MILTIVGSVLVFLGLPFFGRGLALTLKPEGAFAERIRERNLRRGLDPDMRTWGRRVRRFGVLLLLIGGSLIAVGQLT